MEKIINDKYGCQIINRNNKLYIKFDEGEIAIKYAEYEISYEESIEAMESEELAYRVCLRAQLRNSERENTYDDFV